jgi:hypothetical protein
MRIRSLLAVLLCLVALLAMAPSAGAHHRPGHTGGPAAEEEAEERDRAPESTRGSGVYGRGGEEEPQTTGMLISIGVIAACGLIIVALGLKPGGSAPAHH